MRTILMPLAALTTLALGGCAGAAGMDPAGSPSLAAAELSPGANPREHLCRRIGTFAPLLSSVLSLAMPHRAHRAGLHAARSILEEYHLSDCTPLTAAEGALTDPVPVQPVALPAEPQPDPAAESPAAEPQPDPGAETPPPETPPAEPSEPQPQPAEVAAPPESAPAETAPAETAPEPEPAEESAPDAPSEPADSVAPLPPDVPAAADTTSASPTPSPQERAR